MSFECPAYTVAVYGDEENIYRESGDYEDYEVRFSDQPGLGPDGRLASQP